MLRVFQKNLTISDFSSCKKLMQDMSMSLKVFIFATDTPPHTIKKKTFR